MTENRSREAQMLLEAFARFHRLNRGLSPIGSLRPSEVMVLRYLAGVKCPGHLGAKVLEISNFLGVTSPMITQVLNVLESQGLVVRRTDECDRRAVRVTLTEKGDNVTREAREAFDSALEGLVGYLGQADSAELIRLLDKVVEYLRSIPRAGLSRSEAASGDGDR